MTRYLVLSLLAVLLGGCIVVPYDEGYHHGYYRHYGYPHYYSYGYYRGYYPDHGQ